MPHTSTHNYLHIVFGTKERASSIPESVQPKLWAYLAGICRNYNVLPFAIGGMEDHVHMLLRLPPVLALAKALSILKANSSRWMNEHGANFAWQGGYGAFSVSKSNLAAVTKYIREQKLHHRKMTFEEEYRALLKRHGDEME
jgi:putative transposase